MLLAQCYGFVFPCRSASEDMDQSLQLQIFRFQFQWHDQGVEIYFDIDGKEEDHHLFLWLFQIMEINCKQPFETFTHHSMRFSFIKEIQDSRTDHYHGLYSTLCTTIMPM